MQAAKRNTREYRQSARASQTIIGKTVTRLITRPANGGREQMLVLQFSDGSCFEFVSPGATRQLNREINRAAGIEGNRQPGSGPGYGSGLQQLSFFPPDGNTKASSSPVF